MAHRAARVPQRTYGHRVPELLDFGTLTSADQSVVRTLALVSTIEPPLHLSQVLEVAEK